MLQYNYYKLLNPTITILITVKVKKKRTTTTITKEIRNIHHNRRQSRIEKTKVNNTWRYACKQLISFPG